MNTWVTFPGLGIDPFMMNRTAISFSIFGKEINIAWYGIIIVIGIISAFIYACRRAKQVGVNIDTMIDYTLFTVVISVISARLYYVIFYSEGSYDSFYDVIAIWNGGLAIYGAIIGGALTVIVISKIKKKNFFIMADFIAPAVMLGQIIGRWGNFVNGEAHGTVTTLPWRMGIVSTYSTDAPAASAFLCYHPTFLYESLWNLIGFILINVFYKKRRFNGEVLCWYVAWYGFGRGFIELLRTDSLMIGPLRVSSLLGFVSFAVAAAVLIAVPIIKKKQAAAAVSSVETTAEASVGDDAETAEIAETATEPEGRSVTEKADGGEDTAETDKKDESGD